MKKPDVPVTSAIRFLRDKKILFEPHFYNYEEHGGTGLASTALGVSEHSTIKTIVMETNEKKPLIVLMHGDYEVSTKNLSRFIGVKSVEPCDEKKAEKATGYVFGGMSPFGTRVQLQVYVEKTIFDIPIIYINAGKRGFIVEIKPSDLQVLKPVEVQVGIPHQV